MRCAIAVTLTEGFDEAVAAVSPSHNGFYELLGFRQVGSQRSYSQTIDDPVIAVSMDIDQYREPSSGGLNGAAQFMQEFLTERNRFIAHVTDWACEARSHFLTVDLLKRLFVVEKAVLAACSPAQLRCLCRRWGHEIFAAVTADLHIPVRVRLPRKRRYLRVLTVRSVLVQRTAVSRTNSPGQSRLPSERVRRFPRMSLTPQT
jgi:hypothetical protein